MKAPFIFVSPGTLVPETPALPQTPKLLKLPLYLPHKFGIGPSPDRIFADSAYAPLKALGDCWVETLEKWGLASRDVSVEAAKEGLRAAKRKYPNRKIICIGQSQGGLVTAELATDPEFSEDIAACMFVGTPFLGSPATKSKALAWAKCFPGVSEMEPGHESLQLLGERISKEWPRHILPVLIADYHDELVPVSSAFGVKFPKGVEIRKYLISPQAGKVVGDVHHLEVAGRSARHVRMCRRPCSVQIVKNLRTELTPGHRLQFIAA